MFPIRVKISSGTLDIKEYNFKKDSFVGSNDKKYSINDIEYFIVPKEEMKKITGISNENASVEVINKQNRTRNYSK